GLRRTYLRGRQSTLASRERRRVRTILAWLAGWGEADLRHGEGGTAANRGRLYRQPSVVKVVRGNESHGPLLGVQHEGTRDAHSGWIPRQSSYPSLFTS